MTTRFQRGNQLLVKKQYSDALREFLAHAEEVPAEAVHAYVQAAECLRRTNTLVEPVEVEPGVTLVAERDQAGAEALYRKALAIDPYYFPALRGLALVLPSDSPEQLIALEKAVGVRMDPLLVQLLGEFYERAGSIGEARALYQRALRNSPNDRHLKSCLERVTRSTS